MNAKERAEIAEAVKAIESSLKVIKKIITPAPTATRTVTVKGGKPVDRKRLAPHYREGRGPKGHGMGEDGRQQ